MGVPVGKLHNPVPVPMRHGRGHGYTVESSFPLSCRAKRFCSTSFGIDPRDFPGMSLVGFSGHDSLAMPKAICATFPSHPTSCPGSDAALLLLVFGVPDTLPIRISTFDSLDLISTNKHCPVCSVFPLQLAPIPGCVPVVVAHLLTIDAP